MAEKQVRENWGVGELLQRLIQFNTTNPPGNEEECIKFIKSLLEEAGVETKILARTPSRPNLVARLPGQGRANPLLLYGHVDVVTTERQIWKHPPFEGRFAEGYIWGRGALDMKSGVAMMLAAFLRAKAENANLPEDVVLAVVSDEEAGGDYGAKFLVENHADLFKGIKFAIGEFGGFTLYMGKKRFYPIMISEKQICWMRATIRGQGGHGSMLVRGGAMAKLAQMIQRLEKRRLPVHITPACRLMIEKMAEGLPFPASFVLSQLLNPLFTDRVLGLLSWIPGKAHKDFERVPNSRGQILFPVFHNTVNPTIVRPATKSMSYRARLPLSLMGACFLATSPMTCLLNCVRSWEAILNWKLSDTILGHRSQIWSSLEHWLQFLRSQIQKEFPYLI